jgi:ketosteroid isomerase-like protein
MKNSLLFAALILLSTHIAICRSTPTTEITHFSSTLSTSITLPVDTVPPGEIMEVITKVINSLSNFDIDAVANLYTPNALIADDEAPYSWNGPTAGVQWVNAVEKACKDNRLTKLKAFIEPINVYLQTADNVYIVVPVSYTGNLPAHAHFNAKGGFTFVLRIENGKWLIKSQVWMPRKGM